MQGAKGKEPRAKNKRNNLSPKITLINKSQRLQNLLFSNLPKNRDTIL